MHPDYLYEVNDAIALLSSSKDYDGRSALLNATRAMAIGRPDLILKKEELQKAYIDPRVQDKIEQVVKWFVNYVVREN